MTDRELIIQLSRALLLTKADAEKSGFAYGPQSSCRAALRAFERWQKETAPAAVADFLAGKRMG